MSTSEHHSYVKPLVGVKTKPSREGNLAGSLARLYRKNTTLLYQCVKIRRDRSQGVYS